VPDDLPGARPADGILLLLLATGGLSAEGSLLAAGITTRIQPAWAGSA
jgi:hypothetical protein